MAVQFARGSYLVRSANLLDYNRPYTRMAWLRFTTLGTSAQNYFMLGAGGTHYDRVCTSNDGNQYWRISSVSTAGTGNTVGAAITLDTWFHVAMIRRNGSVLELWRDGQLYLTATNDIGTRAAPTVDNISDWNSVGSYGLNNGHMSSVKEWQRALTEAEIKAEMRSQVMLDRREAYAWLPMGSSGGVNFDALGQHTPTIVGTPAKFDLEPPVGWFYPKRPRIYVGVGAAGGATVTPTTGTLTTTGFAPTVTATNHQSVTPTTATLTTTGFAPTVTVADHQSVTPTTATLTTTGFAPTVTATEHQTVTPTTATLTTTGFSPTVTATDHQSVTPTTATLTTTGFAPTVAVSDNQSVTPTTATLTTTGFAPTVTATEHQTVTPITATLTTTGYAPTVNAGGAQVFTPTTAALTTTGFEPTVTATDHQSVTPITATLTTTGFAPTVSAIDNAPVLVTPTTATLTTTGFAPTVTVAPDYAWDTTQGVSNYYKFNPLKNGKARISKGVTAVTFVGLVKAGQKTWNAFPHARGVVAGTSVGVVRPRVSSKARASVSSPTSAAATATAVRVRASSRATAKSVTATSAMGRATSTVSVRASAMWTTAAASALGQVGARGIKNPTDAEVRAIVMAARAYRRQ